MKLRKSLLFSALSLGLLTSININYAQASNSRKVTVYSFKKSGKHYKLRYKKLKTVSKRIKSNGKKIVYKNHVYYYSNKLHGYIKTANYSYTSTVDVPLSHGNKKTHKKNHKKINQSTNTNSDNADSSDDSSDGTITINDAYKAAYRAEALKKINELRQSVGVAPLREDPQLDKVADMRIQQNIDRGDGSISHYDDSGQALCDIDARQLGLDYDGLGENLAMSSIDTANAKDNADALTQLYIDEGPGQGDSHGHYNNLVSSGYATIGISTGVNSSDMDNGDMYDAEDFGTNDSEYSSSTFEGSVNDSISETTNGTDNTNTNDSSDNLNSNDNDNDGIVNGLKKPDLTTHHIETAKDGETVVVRNGQHINDQDQVVYDNTGAVVPVNYRY